jgi:hypothetical protein
MNSLGRGYAHLIRARAEGEPCLTTTSNASALQQAHRRLSIALLSSNSYAEPEVETFIDEFQKHLVPLIFFCYI